MADSRARAKDAVLEGRVLVSGSVASKPERMVDAAEPIEITEPPSRFVSRGGTKLSAALDDLAVDPEGARCLDVGASTGGFTDCLLQRGASEVVAVDVGYGQIAWKLRQDPRVTLLERTDIREVAAGDFGDIDLVTVDVSFISLRTVLPYVIALAPHATIVALVKPQFEVGKGRVGKGGIVRDESLQKEAVEGVVAAAEALGLSCEGVAPSAITGASGNQEYFVRLRTRS